MALDPNIRINLDRSVVLLVDDNPQALEALSAMVRGFGVRKQFKCGSGAEARMSERAIMARAQRNMLEVDCSIWSAALTTLAFIS